jgi:parallel beta-helix repeat protein
MADVFISYSRRDAQIVGELASLLISQGWSVWYDTQIAAGHPFRTDIESEMDAARAIVVVWSTDAVESSWVMAEAEEAASSGKLIPIRLDGCRIPLTMRAIQTVDFDGWNGDPTARPWLALQESISRLAGSPTGAIRVQACDLVVGLGDEATHASVGSALAAAADGQCIEITAGHYVENLVIDRDVQLRVRGVDDVVLDGGDGTAITLENASVSVVGLSIRSAVASGLGVLNVDSGQLNLDQVVVSTAGEGACLRATSKARISMRDCRMTGGLFGCLIAFQSELELYGCTLSEHHGHGILVDRGSTVIIHNSTIEKNGGCGVLAQIRGNVVVRSSVLIDNPVAGVEIRGECTGDVRFSQFSGNGQGMRVGDAQSELRAESNKIESCKLSGIHVHDRGHLVAIRNEITTSHGGVIVFDGASAELTENVIKGNDGHGIEARDGATARITRNHLFRNSLNGVRSTGNAKLEAFADYIALSGTHGVFCSDAELHLNEVTISDSHEFGLLAVDGAKVDARRVLIEASEQTGVEVRSASLAADALTVSRSGEHGIWISREGVLRMRDSEVSVSGLSAIRIETEMSVSIVKCLIKESNDFGIHFLKGSIAALEANRILSNKLPGICIEEGANPQISGNLIENNGTGGVLIRQRGGGSIRQNVLRKNPAQFVAEMPEAELHTIMEDNTSNPVNFHYY